MIHCQRQSSNALTCIELDQTRYICVAQMSIMTDSSGLATFDDLGEDHSISDGELDTSPFDSNCHQ